MRLILMRNTYLAGLAVVIMGISMLFQDSEKMKEYKARNSAG